MQGIAFDEIDHPILNFRKKVFFTRQDVRILTFWPYQMPELPIKQNGLRKHFYAVLYPLCFTFQRQNKAQLLISLIRFNTRICSSSMLFRNGIDATTLVQSLIV
ncbi:hypothetical protein QR076_21025 [Salmonella enterica]|nr:hypothetical protein [Salmonella enterica]